MDIPTPTERKTRLARAAARQLADETTPLIENCWYVAAFSHEVPADRPLARCLLDRRVVLFRDADGQVATLRDRCAHRSYPLSEGRVEQGQIVCGYHGYRYDGSGRCVAIPSEGRCPKDVEVRRFPTVEIQPLIWVWMGDPGQADPALIPTRPWMEASNGWTSTCDGFHVDASYVHLHENLLDLSHLSFLHAETIGTPDYALTPYEMEVREPHFKVTRSVAPTQLPPIYADSTGIRHARAARISSTTFVSPAAAFAEVLIYDTDEPEAQRRHYELKTLHILTPESANSFHYMFLLARNFAQDDGAMTGQVHSGLRAALQEDVDAMEKIARWKATEADPDFYESSTGADHAGLAMRRYLKRLAGAGAVPA